MPIAAAAVDICQPTAKKKRKEVGVAASNESGPPKKQYRYECSAEGCTNQAQNGGVCIKHGAKKKLCSVDDCTKQVQKGGVCRSHGAKKKRCSVEECTNQARKGGVCMRHGAKVEHKRCIVDGCTNQAIISGGVCIKHGAYGDRCKFEGCTLKRDFDGFCGNHQEHRPNKNDYNLQIQQQQQRQQQEQISRMGLASTMSSLGYRHHPPQWNNNNYYDNSLLNSNRVSHCNFEGCNIVAMHGGFCSRHWTHRSSSVAPRDHADSQRGYVQGGGNQNAPTVEIISDDEEAGEKKQASITSRKRNEGVAKQSETAISSDTGEIGEQNIPENKYDAPEKVKDKPNSSSVGDEGNSKDDKEPGTSDQEIAEKKDSDSWGGCRLPNIRHCPDCAMKGGEGGDLDKNEEDVGDKEEDEGKEAGASSTAENEKVASKERERGFGLHEERGSAVGAQDDKFQSLSPKEDVVHAHHDDQDQDVAEATQIDGMKEVVKYIGVAQKVERMSKESTCHATESIAVPKGRLGLTLKIDKKLGGATITEIGLACTFKERIEVGDRVVDIDNHKINAIPDLRVNEDKTRQLRIVKKNSKMLDRNMQVQDGSHQFEKKKTPEARLNQLTNLHKIHTAGQDRKTVVYDSTNLSNYVEPADQAVCSHDGCTNSALKGGVCWSHGAKDLFETIEVPPGRLHLQVRLKNGLIGAEIEKIYPHCAIKESVKVGDRIIAIDNKEIMVISHFNVNEDKTRLLTIARKSEYSQLEDVAMPTFANQRQRRGVCKRHGAAYSAAPPAQENFLCGDIQGGGIQKGGVCIKHGAKVKLCSVDDCTNQAKKGGV